MSRITYHLLGGFAIIALMLIFLFTNNVSGSAFFSDIDVLSVNTPHRASQGIATDGEHVFLTTSLNEKGQRENIISVYNTDGKFLKEKRNASNELDRDDRFMDFGDATVADAHLYVTLYNWNSLPEKKFPLYSKIAVFDTRNLTLLGIYDIGGNAVEAIAYREGHFWTAFHDKPVIKKFDAHFKLINSFPLVMPSNVNIRDGYVQGMVWYGNDILLNIHGPNVECSFYSPGLLRYHYNGSQFEYVETITPPTYGSGQGLEIIHQTFYFVDRPWNAIIKARLIAAQSQSTADSSSKMTSDNGSSVIFASTNVTLEVHNETVESKQEMLSSAVASFLNSRVNVLERSPCDQAIIKTKVANEINNETQNVEGTEATIAIIEVEISKALKSMVQSSDNPNQTTDATINAYSTCKRDALKSIFCDNTAIIEKDPLNLLTRDLH